MILASYTVYSIILGLLFFGVALSLDLIAGHLGLFVLAQGGLMGIGGYVAALTMVHLGVGIVVACVLGALAAGAVAFVAALPALRVRDEYLVVVGLGLQIVVSQIFGNLHVLGGQDGLAGIPAPFGSLNQWVLLLCAAVLTTIVVAVYCLLTMGAMGRTITMIREDDIAAASLGRNVRAIKVGVVTVSGALAGAVGAFYVSFEQYASPGAFDVSQTIFFLTVVFLGGMRSLVGIMLATACLVAVQQYLAAASSGPTAATLEQAGFGVLLVFILLVAPRGLGGALGWAGARVRSATSHAYRSRARMSGASR